MELIVLALFFLLLAVAGFTGRVTDTRDYADWSPSNDGFRAPPRY